MDRHRCGPLLARVASATLMMMMMACNEGQIGGNPGGQPDSGSSKQPGPVPTSETCNNGLDDNLDGKIDEGCVCKVGSTQECFPGPANKASIGICKKGSMNCQGDLEFGNWSSCVGSVGPAQEICGNGIDEDCDGSDLPCSAGKPDAGGPQTGQCKPGDKAPCYDGPPGTAGQGICAAGSKLCQADGSWSACQSQVLPKPEVCDNLVDEDCNGKTELCPGTVALTLNIDGDCVTASCPAAAPFPVGCAINFVGGDNRGCVASTPSSPIVYFQEGDKCSAGHLSGVLFCSSTTGTGLNAANCPINKSKPYYPSSKSGCPELN